MLPISLSRAVFLAAVCHLSMALPAVAQDTPPNPNPHSVYGHRPIPAPWLPYAMPGGIPAPAAETGDIDTLLQQRRQALDAQLWALNPRPQMRREWQMARREHLRNLFEAARQGWTPAAPAMTPWPAPHRDDVDQAFDSRWQEADERARTIDPRGQARKDYLESRRAYGRDLYERRLEAARTEQERLLSEMSGATLQPRQD